MGEHAPMTGTVTSPSEVSSFLAGVHGRPVSGVEPLAGGFWSEAFAYRVGGRELVLRLGADAEGYEMDRAAMAFDGPDLPVPQVLDIGRGLGGAYAISVRHHGRFLETVRPGEAERAGPTIARTLAAFRAVPADPGAPVVWHPPDGAHGSTWRGWLLDGIVDDPRRHVRGWRSTLAAVPGRDRLFRACEARIRSLLDACPERREVVHGDQLHGNVLLDDEAARVTAVFSWKCSVRGDALYDVAWCTFWEAWHPGIAAVDVWRRTVRAPVAIASSGPRSSGST